MTRKRVTLFCGHYGSGKTEFAVNLARKLENPVIADLDIVNPYFRTADVKDALENEGIRVITPEFANTNVCATAMLLQCKERCA